MTVAGGLADVHDVNDLLRHAGFVCVLVSVVQFFLDGGCSLYTGLYEYLMGKAAGSITSASYTGAGDTQKRFPTAIYVSFDLFGVNDRALDDSKSRTTFSTQVPF